MIGMFVESIFSTDPYGKCGCTIQGYNDSTFPVTKLISRVLENNDLNYSDLVCPEGKFPK